jgi:hypothetical protein
MWRREAGDGYLGRLVSEDAEKMLSLVREKHSDGQLVALLYLYVRDTRVSRSTGPRLRIRDAWRGLLLGGRLPLAREALRGAAVLLRTVDPPKVRARLPGLTNTGKPKPSRASNPAMPWTRSVVMFLPEQLGMDRLISQSVR